MGVWLFNINTRKQILLTYCRTTLLGCCSNRRRHPTMHPRRFVFVLFFGWYLARRALKLVTIDRLSQGWNVMFEYSEEWSWGLDSKKSSETYMQPACINVFTSLEVPTSLPSDAATAVVSSVCLIVFDVLIPWWNPDGTRPELTVYQFKGAINRVIIIFNEKAKAVVTMTRCCVQISFFFYSLINRIKLINFIKQNLLKLYKIYNNKKEDHIKMRMKRIQVFRVCVRRERGKKCKIFVSTVAF